MEELLRQQIRIIHVTDGFRGEMLAAMTQALYDGKRGWDDPDCEWWNGDFETEILRRVREKIDEGAEDDEVDIANYMMMLKYLRARRSLRKEGE